MNRLRPLPPPSERRAVLGITVCRVQGSSESWPVASTVFCGERPLPRYAVIPAHGVHLPLAGYPVQFVLPTIHEREARPSYEVLDRA
jgi:hypothetical protein